MSQVTDTTTAASDDQRGVRPDPTAVLRVNHLVLWVRDATASARFYERALGLEVVHEIPGGVFMRAPGSGNDHDLGLFSANVADGARPGAPGMYHVAWEVPTLGALADRARRLAELGALTGASSHGVSKSLYAKDPDGNEFEVMWAVPPALLGPGDRLTTTRLDLDAEVARFGADTPGHRADAS